MYTGGNTGGNTSGKGGFEKGLSEKGKFYLYLSIVCPYLDIIHILWKQYKYDLNEEAIRFYQSISPFQDHPCGNDCILHPVGGFIDPDIFLEYYNPRQSYLISIEMIGHPDFICQYKQTKALLEQSHHYFDTLLNEPKQKIIKLKKVKVLEMVINYLSETRNNLSIDQIMQYLLSFFNMYKDMKILHAHSLAVDSNFQLCRFE